MDDPFLFTLKQLVVYNRPIRAGTQFTVDNIMTFGMLTYCQILKIVKLKDEMSVFFMVVEFWLLCVNGLC